MRSWLWIAILVAACSGPSLPPFPSVKTTGFTPAIREKIDRELAAARSMPDDPERSGQLGMLLHAHDRMDAASICYERARLLRPEDYRWQYLSGVAKANLARNEEAIERFQKALAIRSDDVAARLRLGEALLAQRKYDESRAQFTKIIEQQPSEAIAYYGAGRAYASEGHEARASEFYRQACERFSKYAAAHYALSLLYRQQGRTEDAKRHLQAYESDRNAAPPREEPLLAEVQSMGGGILPLLGRAKAAAAAGRLEEAVALHLQALELDPQQEQIRINLISLYGRLKQFDQAEAQYKTLLASNRARDEGHYNYAVMLSEQGRHSEAIVAYQRALSVNPRNAAAHNNLAFLLAQQRKFDAALSHALKALESEPNYAQAHYNAALIFLNRGEVESAIRHFEAASARDPGEPRYSKALAAAYKRR